MAQPALKAQGKSHASSNALPRAHWWNICIPRVCLPPEDSCEYVGTGCVRGMCKVVKQTQLLWNQVNFEA